MRYGANAEGDESGRSPVTSFIRLAARAAATGCTGWSCRALPDGWVEPSLSIALAAPRSHHHRGPKVAPGNGRNRGVTAAREFPPAHCS